MGFASTLPSNQKLTWAGDCQRQVSQKTLDSNYIDMIEARPGGKWSAFQTGTEISIS
jgi:hypothetical protein